MKLLVQVIEARCLPAIGINGLSDPCVRLQLGKRRSKTKVVKKSLNPCWDEEFSFKVGDLSVELVVSVLDEDKYFHGEFLGQVRIPLLKVFDAENLSLGIQWYQLHPKKKKKAKLKNCGEIRLGISFLEMSTANTGTPPLYHSFSEEVTSSSDKSSELMREPVPLSSNGKVESSPVLVVEDSESCEKRKSNGTFVDLLLQFFTRRGTEVEKTLIKDADMIEDVQETALDSEVSVLKTDSTASDMTLDELLKVMESKDQGSEMPDNFPGGVVLDKSYVVSSTDLNSLIFSPTSNFSQSLADLQGASDFQAEPWKLENGGESLKRVVTYTTAATKIVKSVKGTEEQKYLKADGKSYAVSLSVSTPDVPFGSYFRTEILFCIMPGPELATNEATSRLVISWRVNFLQSTMMKGMIENGARHGIKDNYALFADLLSQNVKPVDLQDAGSDKEQILASLQIEQESDWKLLFRFFGNFTVISSVIVALYVAVHILLANPSNIMGLEFPGLDLPDSIGEVVVCGVLVLQGERVLNMFGRYMQARKQRGGSDHGVRARGDGWLLTVALIEGSNLAAVDSSGYSDPYVVFTCNGTTKTSSIKFQTPDPQWKEVFEFDAMEDPPSMMDVDVYDFDGPFDDATSLGHAEVNFVKSNLSELADVWISLEGKLAQACQSKLHLRIFLNNTRGTELVTEYLTKMEKEVGKKINVRSPQTNSAFQKIFGLPPEEFLINDFTCHLKRKMPMQGRLFLSPRIIGYYTNLFGHKTRFFFLWEDIEEILVVPPSLSSMGSPSLVIILRRGRGIDARHGAKCLEKDGRLKFHFQSFVSFNVANRTIMALWKAKSLSPEQKVQIVEEESEERALDTEENGSFRGIEDAKMSEIFSSVIPIPINSLMEFFSGSLVEQKIMEKVGCVDYSVTPWESVKADIYQRQVQYKFAKDSSRYGATIASTQQKSSLPDDKGWVVEEVVAIQGTPLGDYFDLHIRYHIEDLSPKSKACNVQVSQGISWLKSTKHQKRITKNVVSHSSDRLKEVFFLIEKEFTIGK